MPKLTASEGANKWAKRTKAAVQETKEGIARVTESPTDKAADRLDKLLARLTEAIVSGKMERALRDVSLAEWKRLADAGTARIAGGVDAKGLSKMEKFARDFYPYLEQVQNEIAGMPDSTFEDSLSRMTHNARRLHEYKK